MGTVAHTVSTLAPTVAHTVSTWAPTAPRHTPRPLTALPPTVPATAFLDQDNTPIPDLTRRLMLRHMQKLSPKLSPKLSLTQRLTPKPIPRFTPKPTPRFTPKHIPRCTPKHIPRCTPNLTQFLKNHTTPRSNNHPGFLN